ncbi:hypothetical protein BDD12DRAFT_895780 [Trichophaea hybrida]|nr:hypothetical protein BDD12DRAFT_895780 [Trichophaea hybrida]
MIYGYNTYLTSHPVNDRLVDYERHFSQQLDNARSQEVQKSPLFEAKYRPIIFIGHSFGGILISLALVTSKSHLSRKHLLESTHAVLLFGTPFRGLHTVELEYMIQDLLSEDNCYESRLNILRKLGKDYDSEWRKRLLENFPHIWEGRKVVSFYETVATPTVSKSTTTSTYERAGPSVKMVEPTSARLFLPNEEKVPVPENHSNMVKFMIPSDRTYETVTNHTTV